MTNALLKRWAGSPASRLAAALALSLAAVPALASDNVFDPSRYAFAAAFGSPSTSFAEIRDGVTLPLSAAGSGSFSTSVSPDGHVNSASVATNAGNTASAIADLRLGGVRASVVIGSNDPNAARGFADAQIYDTVFFDNTSGGNLLLPVNFSFDGSISDMRNFGSTAYGAFTITGGLSECPGGGFGTCSGDHSLRFQNGTIASQNLVVGYASNGTFNGVQQGGAFFFNAPDNVDLTTYSVFKDWNSIPGYYNTVISTGLVLPTGRSRIGFGLRVLLDCSDVGTICNFENTGKVGFGALPDGLSFTSASGAFLTGAPGGVPEPASWAMMIAGFGLTGATMRRRRLRVVAA